MNRIAWALCCGWLCGVCPVGLADSDRGDSDRPNVVFLLADDLGWSDTTLYGTTHFHQTPNIERLAARGMTFSRAWAASPLCSPTRASLLTGLSPARHGITSPSCHLPREVLHAAPGDRAAPNRKAVPTESVTRLLTSWPTLPNRLQAEGYATGHFGKWHLGPEPWSPLEHGFDVDRPHHPGPGPAGSYVAPWKFRDFDHDPDVPDQHIEDRMAAEAVAWMTEHQDQPFFLNYWMFSVHAPFDAKTELIEKHRQRVDPSLPQRSPTYAAMVESLDDAVGTLLDAIDRLGLADRTIIVFTSDNGGNMYSSVDGTVPTSNAPLRGGKATMFEGGVRVPCVIVWPDVTPGGSRSEAIVQSCDFFPTLLEMLELQPLPDQIFDGVSIVPALRGQPMDHPPVVTFFPHAPPVPDWLPPSVSLHDGRWKLIRLFHGGENGSHAWRLFDLQNDIGEKRDLTTAHPERVRRMDGQIEQFLRETQAVVPAPNPAFEPAQWDPEQIGLPAPRNRPRGQQRSAAATPVGGWIPSRQCRLQLTASALRITSSGRDPYITLRLPEPLPAGQWFADLTLASTGAGDGQFFWQEATVRPAFFRDRSIRFAVTHDARPHSSTVSFSAAHAVPAIRIDPGQTAGQYDLVDLKIRDGDGRLVVHWTPNSQTPPKTSP